MLSRASGIDEIPIGILYASSIGRCNPEATHLSIEVRRFRVATPNATVAAARTLYGSVVVINVQRDALYYDNRSRLFGSHKGCKYRGIFAVRYVLIFHCFCHIFITSPMFCIPIF